MNMLKDARDSIVVKDRNGTRDVDIQYGPIWDLKKNFFPQYKANEAVVHSEYLRVNTCDLHPTISGGESQTRPDPLDLMSYDSGWFPRAFLSREMPPGVQACIAMNHRNLKPPLTYPPVLPECTLEEFYGIDGPVTQTFDFHTKFPQMFADDVEAARVCIVSDSCYPIDAIGSLVHGDTRTMSMPRSTYSEMARVLNTFKVLVKENNEKMSERWSRRSIIGPAWLTTANEPNSKTSTCDTTLA